MFSNKAKVLCAFVGAAAVVFSAHAQISISGTVIDGSGNGVPGATVSLVEAGYSTTTDSQGLYTLTGATGVRAAIGESGDIAPVKIGNSIRFSVANGTEKVSVDIYDLNGRILSHAVHTYLARGAYSYTPAFGIVASSFNVVRLQVGAASATFKMTVCEKNSSLSGLRALGANGAQGLAKRLDISDTLVASKTMYVTFKKYITSYTLTNQILPVTAITPAKELGIISERTTNNLNWALAKVYVWDQAIADDTSSHATTLNLAYTGDKEEGTKSALVTCGTLGWSGWGIAPTDTAGVDMSGYTGGKLHMYVKGNAQSIGVEVTWNVKAAQVVDLANYGYVAGDGNWHLCEIPFTDFGPIVMTNITYYVAFVCPAATGGAYTSGETYMIDDVTWKPAQ